MNNIPVSVIIPTINKAEKLSSTLDSLRGQSYQPMELIIVDASEDHNTENAVAQRQKNFSRTFYLKANQSGAALQRIQGLKEASQPYILFMDDDIILEKGCLSGLWELLENNKKAGGVNALITNQNYKIPGKSTRIMVKLLNGPVKKLAGKCVDPVWNFLPSDDPSLPDYNRVDWLNTTCTLYRRDALPIPLFPTIFYGYSLMEDLALSLQVGKNWELYNARNSRIYHDSQISSYKSNIYELARMSLINRHYIFVNILKRRSFKDYLKLFIFELFTTLTAIKAGKSQLIKLIRGKLSGLRYIMFNK